ncbi:STAS/SEC14 domain-containing protein [Fulvivirga ulvae]|uniref:STAS/SEC14 domain-containing protein n=1 Tax=Fulvivirga ulvae TaxID=2904245 RepID=UPI001F16AD9C|nr:STAS/SEC14 domain-containing protein [Fulvivirga ulvae]UII31483.1 STAS/SEC14 domain-containing protein [Fulvivirga ulvae]
MENNLIRLHATENRFFDYDAEVPCITSTGHGFMMSQEFRDFMRRGLELIQEKIEENGKIGWLVDVRYVEVFEAQDTEWVVSYWNVKAYEAGLRFVAFILPENVFAMMNIEDYTEQSVISGTLTVQHFDNMESARNWLKEVV